MVAKEKAGGKAANRVHAAQRQIPPTRLRAIGKWLVAPVVAYLAYDIIFSNLVPELEDADIGLLMFQAVLCVFVIAWLALMGKRREAGWVRPVGFIALLVAGPMWLPILTPLPAALEFYQSAPQKLVPLLLVSICVAINEETIFRGIVLNGLCTAFRPLYAVLLSSAAFGIMHFLNLAAGGDPVFVAAQAVAAAGTGAVMGAIALHARSVVPAMVLHFAVDFIGLGALGGFANAIQSREIAPSLVVSGGIVFIWGIFWTWRFERKHGFSNARALAQNQAPETTGNGHKNDAKDENQTD